MGENSDASVDSVSYRFQIASVAANPSVTVAPCTLLHAQPRFMASAFSRGLHSSASELPFHSEHYNHE